MDPSLHVNIYLLLLPTLFGGSGDLVPCILRELFSYFGQIFSFGFKVARIFRIILTAQIYGEQLLSINDRGSGHEGP